MNLKEAHAELRTFLPTGYIHIRSEFWDHDHIDKSVSFGWVIQVEGAAPLFQSSHLEMAVELCRLYFYPAGKTVEQASAQLEEAKS